MQLLSNMVEQHAISAPDDYAIQYEDEPSLSYKRLNDRANQLAHYLLANGISAQQPVVVWMERSVDWIVAVLALAKISAIYVPFDADNLTAAERFQHVIADSSPVCILTHQHLVYTYGNLLSSYQKVIAVDKAQHQIAQYPAIFTHSDSKQQDITHIVYTSGSTGKPKGVMLGGAGLNYWAGVIEAKTTITRGSKVLAGMSAAFDASIWEMLTAFSRGATLYIASAETRCDPAALMKFISKHSIEHALLIPAQLQSVDLDTVIPELATKGLCAIYSTGEACTPHIVNTLHKHHVKVFNCYGPTESTFGYSIAAVSPVHVADGRVPIGAPREPVVGYVLDENLQLVTEPGKEGVLYIASPYLAPGYLNRPDETQEKFIERKINDKVVRMYNTCDKVKISQDAELFYLGRAGALSHVKINGTKLEPLGLEAILSENKDIQSACIVVFDNEQPLRLVACVVMKSSCSLDEQLLRKNLYDLNPALGGARLDFIAYERLPLTNTGKVDRKKLEQEARAYQFDRRKPETFKTPLQRTILSLISQVLGSNNIHLHLDDELSYTGLSSIKLASLINKINAEFGIKLSLATAYLPNQTIAEFVNLVQQARWQANANEPAQLLSEGDKGQADHRYVFVFPPITGHSACYLPLIENLKKQLPEGSNISYYGLNMRGLSNPLDISSVPDIQIIAQDFARAIKQVQPGGSYRFFAWSSGGAIAYEVAALLEKQNATVKFLGLIDSLAPQIYQEMSDELFAKNLLDLVKHILAIVLPKENLTLSINLDTLSSYNKTQQIDMIRDILLAQIEVQDTEAYRTLVVAANSLKSLLYYKNSKKLTNRPLVFSCADTITQFSYMLTRSSQDLLGWKSSSCQPKVGAIFDEGDHFSLLRVGAPSFEQLASELAENLAASFSNLVVRRDSTSSSSSNGSEANSSSLRKDDFMHLAKKSVIKAKPRPDEEELLRRQVEEGALKEQLNKIEEQIVFLSNTVYRLVDKPDVELAKVEQQSFSSATSTGGTSTPVLNLRSASTSSSHKRVGNSFDLSYSDSLANVKGRRSGTTNFASQFRKLFSF